MSDLVHKPVIYLIICAAPPAQHMHEFIPVLQTAGWDVCVRLQHHKQLVG